MEQEATAGLRLTKHEADAMAELSESANLRIIHDPLTRRSRPLRSDSGPSPNWRNGTIVNRDACRKSAHQAKLSEAVAAPPEYLVVHRETLESVGSQFWFFIHQRLRVSGS